MLLFLLSIQIINCFSFSIFKSSNIFQLGEYTNLICSLNQKYMFNSTNSGWEKNKIRIVTTHLNKRTYWNYKYDKKKYNSLFFDNKLILQIKNINENDKNSVFYCCFTYTYERCSLFFLNESLINYLSPNNINIEYVNLTKINIYFKKIYPVPKCFIQTQNEFIFFKNITSIKTHYIYLKVNLSMNIKELYEFKIICTLLNNNFTIYSINNNYKSNSLTLLIIFSILFLIFNIIIMTFISFKIKSPTYNILYEENFYKI